MQSLVFKLQFITENYYKRGEKSCQGVILVYKNNGQKLSLFAMKKQLTEGNRNHMWSCKWLVIPQLLKLSLNNLLYFCIMESSV